MGKILNTDNPKGLNSLQLRNKRNKANIVLEEDEVKILVNGKEKYNLANISGGKQDTLVSGTNIKTINGNSILGGGNMVIDIPDELNGTNYLMVYGTGTPAENAAELQAAYDEAKSMPRYRGDIWAYGGSGAITYKGQTFQDTEWGDYRIATEDIQIIDNDWGYYRSKSALITIEEARNTRTKVIVAPGQYTVGGGTFTMDASGIDVISLTGRRDVIIDGVILSASFVYCSGIDATTSTFEIYENLSFIVVENCRGGEFSFGSSQYNTTGTFIDCVGGDASFGASGDAKGIYIRCTAGSNSFGGAEGIASGEFIDCVGGDYSFGAPMSATGVFTRCIGGEYSFGGETTGKLYYCRVTAGTLPTTTTGGKVVLCIDGNNQVVTL
jgi:hypothetical protein